MSWLKWQSPFTFPVSRDPSSRVKSKHHPDFQELSSNWHCCFLISIPRILFIKQCMELIPPSNFFLLKCNNVLHESSSYHCIILSTQSVKFLLYLSQAVHSHLSCSVLNGSQSHGIISYWTWPTLFSLPHISSSLPRADILIKPCALIGLSALDGKMRSFLIL